MKNFTFQILSAMMLVMSYTAPNPLHGKDEGEKALLEQIKNEAERRLKFNHAHGKVKQIHWPNRNGTTCWSDFFCLAEKALKDTTLKRSNLTHFLEKYNKEYNPENCHLPKTRTITIIKFLEDVKHCAQIKHDKLHGKKVIP